MCKIVNVLKKAVQRTGFKVALKINGRYYSPATGVEYKKGKVPMCPDYDEDTIEYLLRLCNYFSINRIFTKPDSEHSRRSCHLVNFNGNTTVFKNISDTIELLRYVLHCTDHEVVILKMALWGRINGTYQEDPVFAGFRIIKMKQIFSIKRSSANINIQVELQKARILHSRFVFKTLEHLIHPL